MKSLSQRCWRLDVGIRWIARLLAASVVGMVLLILVGEGSFDPLKLTAQEAVLTAFFFTTCIGMVLAWRWEVTGGLVSLAGILLFFAVEVVAKGRLPSGPFFYLMLLPGILFILSGFARRKHLESSVCETGHRWADSTH